MAHENSENDPYLWVEKWTTEEGVSPLFGVLATTDTRNQPYTRTIAIREIGKQGVLFFTQKGSLKVQHIQKNPAVSLTLYLPSHFRQITFRGTVHPLSDEENDRYWQTYRKESQLRFLVYGPRSGEVTASNAWMDQKLTQLREEYRDKEPPRPEAYVGYRIDPNSFEFYQLNADRISDSFRVQQTQGEWEVLRVVP